jgi:hypothetical protein
MCKTLMIVSLKKRQVPILLNNNTEQEKTNKTRNKAIKEERTPLTIHQLYTINYLI